MHTCFTSKFNVMGLATSYEKSENRKEVNKHATSDRNDFRGIVSATIRATIKTIVVQLINYTTHRHWYACNRQRASFADNGYFSNAKR